MQGDGIHGEIITDGDASGGVSVVLYEDGSTTARTLADTEFLVVTDIQISTEVGGLVSLVADSKAAGRYLVHMTLDAKGGVVQRLSEPYACPRGTGLKFFGIATGLDVCLIQGFITKA